MHETDTAPSIKAYLDEPLYEADQDDEASDVFALAVRTLVTPMAPRTWEEALDAAAAQSVHRSKDWTGRCQEFCRTMPGCPGGAASALDAWFGMPDGARIVGGSPDKVEPGWQLFSRSRNPDALASRFGHVIMVGRDFTDGNQSAWSTDAIRTGWPDRVNPSDLYARWNHEYLGAARWQNGLWLDVKVPRVKPVQDTPYAALGASLVDADRVLHKLEKARDTAKAQEDWDDRDYVQDLIRKQRSVRSAIAEAFDELRRVA